MVEAKILKPTSKKENATLVVKLMDGHFDDDTWWDKANKESLFCHQQLLEAVGGKQSSCLQSSKEGRIWRDFILDSLPEKFKKKGTKSQKFLQVFISNTVLALNLYIH